jgi:hypothetical protein
LNVVTETVCDVIGFGVAEGVIEDELPPPQDEQQKSKATATNRRA